MSKLSEYERALAPRRARWLEECCERVVEGGLLPGEVYRSWRDWARGAYERPGRAVELLEWLAAQGVRYEVEADIWGLRLKPPACETRVE